MYLIEAYEEQLNKTGKALITFRSMAVSRSAQANSAGKITQRGSDSSVQADVGRLQDERGPELPSGLELRFRGLGLHRLVSVEASTLRTSHRFSSLHSTIRIRSLATSW